MVPVGTDNPARMGRCESGPGLITREQRLRRTSPALRCSANRRGRRARLSCPTQCPGSVRWSSSWRARAKAAPGQPDSRRDVPALRSCVAGRERPDLRRRTPAPPGRPVGSIPSRPRCGWQCPSTPGERRCLRPQGRSLTAIGRLRLSPIRPTGHCAPRNSCP
jgi:hypothetical protein